MEKIITIDNKEVAFKASATFLLIYRQYFNQEPFKDLLLIQKIAEDPENIDLLPFYRIVWCLHKCADKNAPELLTWVDEFEEFPVIDIFKELNELITASFKVTKNLIKK